MIKQVETEYLKNAQCAMCGCFGVYRTHREIYWTCDNTECGEKGGIFIEPIRFYYRVSKTNTVHLLDE